MKRSTLFTAIGVVAIASAAAFASQAARQPLFAPAAQTARIADASYSALAGDRATVGLQLVQADASQIADTTDSLQLSLGGGDLVAHKLSFVRNPDGTQVWQGQLGKDPGMLGRLTNRIGGEIENDPNNSAIIVRNGDKLTGTLRVDGDLYALRPLRSGGHAIARIDESRMPADHPGEYALLPKIQIPQSISTKAAITTPVMVVSTQSAAAASRAIV
nr:hypothetical protein [Xanthomonadaceae bacterium]